MSRANSFEISWITITNWSVAFLSSVSWFALTSIWSYTITISSATHWVRFWNTLTNWNSAFVASVAYFALTSVLVRTSSLSAANSWMIIGNTVASACWRLINLTICASPWWYTMTTCYSAVSVSRANSILIRRDSIANWNWARLFTFWRQKSRFANTKIWC